MSCDEPPSKKSGLVGQLLTSNGNAAPTFQSVDAGGWVKLGTYTAASTSVDMTSVMDSSLYQSYKMIISSLQVSSSANLGLYFSTDNGATWDTSSVYADASRQYPLEASATGVAVAASGLGYFHILSNLAASSKSYILMNIHPIDSKGAYMNGYGVFKYNTDSKYAYIRYAGRWVTTTTANAIQLFSGSDISGTVVELYGNVK